MKIKQTFLLGLMCFAINNVLAATTSEQMELVDLAMASKGGEGIGFLRTGSLRSGQTKDYTVHVIKGKQYAIVGVSDNTTKDMDLSLRDDEGDVIEKDFDKDSTPLFSFKAQHNSYTVRVHMVKCTDNPCYYRVKAYRIEK